jgi:hypothetical protein
MVRSAQLTRLAKACTLAVLTASVLACSASVAPAAGTGKSQDANRDRHRTHPLPLYWGAWIGDQITGTPAPRDMGAASRFEEIVGKGMSLIEFSSPFAECAGGPCHFFGFPRQSMEDVRLHGSIPFFSWGSESIPREGVSQGDFQLSDLIEGRYDSYIREFATEAREWGRPFFLRFDWEMNGNWLPWAASVNGNQPGQYVAAWRHVHDLFVGVGASNVTWVWCPYADEKHKYPSLRSFYPGSAYVDWTCMDGYNWGLNAVNPQRWKSFSQLFESTYRELTKKVAPHKPLLIGEMASSPNGGHKGLWIRQMFKDLPRKFPRVRALIWFDTVDRGVQWPIEASATATREFAAGLRRKTFANNRFLELPAGPIRPLR